MKKNSQFLHNLIVYSLTSLVCSFLFSYSYLFHFLWLSLKHFLFTSLPDFWGFFFNPRCFFLVGNTIILFLIGEWKFLGSLQSPAAEIYDEYAARSPSSGRALSDDLQEGKEKVKNLVEESLNEVEEEREDEEEEREEEKDGDEDEDEDDEEEDQPELPAEELNKRVEEFIARINKQRWLETKLLVQDDSSPEDMQFY